MKPSPIELSWRLKRSGFGKKIDVVDGDSAMWLENELCDGWICANQPPAPFLGLLAKIKV